jgi:2-hydroxy-3-keto-5-methylthiopentenyl-1-phosphate phosphatase
VRSRFKERWAEHFGSVGAPVIYVGDGTSDIAAASRCAAVFARDSLLSGLRDGYEGVLLPFATLLDVAHGLRSLQRD